MSYAEEYVKRLQQISAARILGELQPQAPSKSDFANLILQKARSDWSTTYPSGPSQPKDKGGFSPKSFALGLLDKLARPGYALAEAENVAFNQPGASIGDVLKGAGRGITGKSKTSYIDVLQKQHENKIKDTQEYKDILAQYGQKEADWYEQTQKAQISKNDITDTAGGLIVDFVQDPLNLVGAGLLTKPFKAAKNISKAATEATDVERAASELGRETATSAVPEATQAAQNGIPMPAGPGLSQDLIDKLRNAKTADQTVQDFPRVEGKFGSNRRPPVKTVEGEQVKADFSGSILDTLRQNPRFANLTDVFKRDLRPSDFQDLQKARISHETAQVVDQVAKGNPAAVDLLTNKNINPLAPVARTAVDEHVNQIIREITDSVADPVKAKALGKQPRHPVFNAPTQNNLSNRISNSVKSIFSIKGSVPPELSDNMFNRYMDMLKNSEESLIHKARSENADAFYPRGGIKPDSPYLRLSDVLSALPHEIAKGAIFGTKGQKVHVGTLLKAITGSNAALGKISHNRELFNAVQNTDWTPLMVKEHATRTIDQANAAKSGADQVAGLLNKINSDGYASDATKAAAADKVVGDAKKSFSKEAPAVKSTMGEMLDGLRKSIYNPVPDFATSAMESGKYKLAAGVFGGKNGQKVAQGPRVATSKAVIEDVTGVNAKDAAVDLNKASEAGDFGVYGTVMKWINPAFGYKDLRQVLLKNVSVRKTSATTRASEVIKVVSKIPEREILPFWGEVTGALPSTPQHAESVATLQKMIHNLFGESGLAEKFANNSAIARAGINVDHLNKHLRIVGVKDFKFTRDVPDPLDASKTIRLNPDQVLDTWKLYKPENSKDLRRFVFNLSQAVENAMVEYSAFSNVAALWGSKTAKNGYIAVTGMHSAIDGMYFPKDMVSQIGAMSHGIDQIYESVANSQLLRLYDTGLRTWKTGVTIYSPSHHIRNMIGDMFTAWLDGVNDPSYYVKAGHVLVANYHRYSDIKPGKNPFADILGSGREAELVQQIIGQAKTKIPKGTRIIAKAKVGNRKFPMTIDQVYQMGFRHGLFPHSSVVEDLPGSETLAEMLAAKVHPNSKVGPFQPFGGKVSKGVKNLSESREHYVRIAHYLHALEHTKANSLDELFQKAADRVRKYHPDGLDLTNTEKRVFRRLIPFYSWNRKAIPLIVEGVLLHPAKILAYPKIMSAIQEYQGIDSSVSDPWPDDQLFPDWLASNSIGPILPPDNKFAKYIARSPQEEGYTVIDPGTPATDLTEQFFNNPIKGIGNALTPALKIPAEIGFGTEFQSGAPIKDKTEYIDKNVPLLSTVSRLTNGAVGTGLLQGGDLKGKETSGFNPVGLINYLTAAGIIDTGRYQKGGEFDLKKHLAEQKKKQNGSQ